MTNPAVPHRARRLPAIPVPGYSGAPGVRAPLSTLEWKGLSPLAAQNVTVIEVIAEQDEMGEWYTDFSVNDFGGSLGTSVAQLAEQNPNRIALYMSNLGGVPITVGPFGNVSTSKGYTIQASGGFMSVVGNVIDIVSPSSSRASLIDRNSLEIAVTGISNPGAGTLVATTLWTYTVPTGRAFEGSFMRALAKNANPQVLNNNAACFIDYQPSGGSLITTVSVAIQLGELSQEKEREVGAAVKAKAGAVFRGRAFSNNNAIGTDVSLEASMAGLEGDA